jgi:hypothetical protein
LTRKLEIGDDFAYRVNDSDQPVIQFSTPILQQYPVFGTGYTSITERDLEDIDDIACGLGQHKLYGYCSGHGILNRETFDPNKDIWTGYYNY